MSAEQIHSYKLLAELLQYPTDSTLATARLAAMFLEVRCPEAANLVRGFARELEGSDTRDLEERYAAVFDFHPARTLDLGYQIFGETYKRGVFLVRMKEAVAAHAVEIGSELPDHLPTLLRLLVELEANEEPRDLVVEVILPCVEKILRTFEEGESGYRAVLAAVKALLMSDYDVTHVEPPPPIDEAASSATGFRLPVFPGFHSPAERGLS
ncbi:MAG: hypothetical protein U0441_21025 [Polyangiaceae bacterium]